MIKVLWGVVFPMAHCVWRYLHSSRASPMRKVGDGAVLFRFGWRGLKSLHRGPKRILFGERVPRPAPAASVWAKINRARWA
ncbi:hypothetical protein [Pedosphaera parvula]|uniref:Uncharacterized protein n=1 Tax=Pedosphaera parvula (strain Ellin514) TaxID=320771 RepID=B9XQQ0_PEDPL|nr:hypothetical protein [Pedosphaera parvula]EEF57832.1 hypothetical protein Cflav_PD0814 [Pedosphaera parvula Ellin514]